MKAEPARCFKCEVPVAEAMTGMSAWDGAGGGINFVGDCNYGSAIYDPLVDGENYELIICDECATKHAKLIRKFQTGKGW